MDSNGAVAKIREILATSAPQVTVSNPKELLAYAAELSPEFKVQLIEAMGFQKYRARHQITCVSIQGSGLICTCTWPETVWTQPQDVAVFRHETREERATETAKRIVQEAKDPEDAENLFDPSM